MKTYRQVIKDHKPNGKRPWEVTDSSCEITVNDYDGTLANPRAWLSIDLSEQYTTESGRIMSKTVSVTLNPEQRAALIEMLTRSLT